MRLLFFSSFQFETETEGGKLRRNVLEGGDVSSGGAPAGIISMLSGEEEMFAFRRAVSRFMFITRVLFVMLCYPSHHLYALRKMKDGNKGNEE